jgi:hypothetical protein
MKPLAIPEVFSTPKVEIPHAQIQEPIKINGNPTNKRALSLIIQLFQSTKIIIPLNKKAR